MRSPRRRGPGRTGRGGLLAAAALMLLALPPAAHAQVFETGVTNTYESAPLAFERVKGAGANFVRIPLHWRATAPPAQPASWDPTNPNDPSYDWGESDVNVQNAVAAGLTPVLEIDGVPRWVERCDSPPAIDGPAICDPDPAWLGLFAVAAARRYSGSTPGIPRVRYWQALNEPNLTIFFFPQFDTEGHALSPILYRRLLSTFYAGVKSVDPSNLVLTAGLGPVAVPPWTMGPMRFARELLCMRGHKRPKPQRGDCEGGVYFDIFAMQPYTTGGPTHEGKVNDVQIGDLGKLQKLLRAAERAGRINGAFARTPLWITEFSWDTKPPDPGGLPPRIEVRWISEALHAAWSAGVTHFFWYSLRDSPRDGSEPFSHTVESGLYFRGGSLEADQPKPILRAFRFPFVAYPGRHGLGFWGRTPNARGGKLIVQVQSGGRWRKAASVRVRGSGIFHGRIPTGYGRGGKGAARAVFAGEASAAFSMKPIADFRHPPFG